MATKKKVTAKKKSAPKKKVAPKKKAAKKKSIPKTEEVVRNEPVEIEEIDRQEEENEPTLPPVYTPSSTNPAEPESQEEEPGSPLFKYLIIAAVLLLGIVIYSVMKKGDNPAGPDSGSEKEEVQDKKETDSPKSNESEDKKKDSDKSSTDSSKDEPVADKKDVSKEPEAEKKLEKAPEALKGFAVAQMASNKTYDEAMEHCKSINMKVPTPDELRKTKGKKIPEDFQKTVVWTSYSAGATNLKFLFSNGKALKAKKSEKYDVLCKE